MLHTLETDAAGTTPKETVGNDADGWIVSLYFGDSVVHGPVELCPNRREQSTFVYHVLYLVKKYQMRHFQDSVRFFFFRRSRQCCVMPMIT
jgi:hypothetical protein